MAYLKVANSVNCKSSHHKRKFKKKKTSFLNINYMQGGVENRVGDIGMNVVSEILVLILEETNSLFHL